MASKLALIIANTEYHDTSFAKLTAPGKDAEEFAQVLRDAELAAFDDVQVLINEGEGKTRRAIARFFAERKRDDLLLLYFSGHGIRDGQGQLFLAVNDTEIKILEASGIPAEFITYAMNNSRSQRQLLILDCCNSGAFAYGSKSAATVGKSMGIASAFEGSGFGRVVLTATDATQFAWEGDKVIGNTQKSVFTHFLIEGLKGDADRNGDGRIDVDELYDYAYEQVVSQTPKQTPGKWSYRQQGEIILRDNLKPRDARPAPLPSDLLEILTHSSSFVRSSGVQELIRLLDGKHFGLARAAEDKLREIAGSDDSLNLRKTANDALTARGFTLEQNASVPVKIRQNKKENLPVPPREFAYPRRLEQDQGYKPKKSEILPNLRLYLIGGITGGLLLITLFIWGIASLLNNLPFALSQPTRTLHPDPARTFLAEIINTPSPIATVILTTSTLGVGSTKVAEKDRMTLVYVPAGEFVMGSNNGESDERPAHKVYLDAFWIDRTEVTNEQFIKCVEEGNCSQPSLTLFYRDPNYANHPVAYIDWPNANAYCSWAGRRLPTEAEWEKTARGEHELKYPWGNDEPNQNLLNYKKSWGITTEVGKYPDGASPYGAFDMVGNVAEWVSSLYKPYPYSATDGREDLTAVGERVQRGLGWFTNGAFNGSSTKRSADSMNLAVSESGFRCALSP